MKAQSKVEHTAHPALPWEAEATSNMSPNTHSIFADGTWLFSTTKETAQFIVLACNTHAGLVEALESELEALETWLALPRPSPLQNYDSPCLPEDVIEGMEISVSKIRVVGYFEHFSFSLLTIPNSWVSYQVMNANTKVMAETQCEVVHEEVITHADVNRKVNGWRAEARVIVTVKIHGRNYEFNDVISLRLKPQEEDEDNL